MNTALASAIDLAKITKNPADNLHLYESFDLAADAYVVTDGAGTIQEANLVTLLLLQVSARALRGQPLLRYLAKDSRKLLLALLRRLHSTGRAEACKVLIQPFTGPQIQSTLTVITARGTAGKSLSLHWILRYTSESFSSDAFHATVSESWSEHSLSQTRGLLCTHDLDGTILFFNRAAATSLGYQAETLVGTSLRDFLTPPQQGQFGKYLQQLPLDTSMDGVLQLFTSTGSLRNFRYRNSLHKVAGYPLYVRIQLQDPFGQRLGDDHKGVIYSIPQSQREPKGSLFTVNSALQSELLHYRETRNTLLRDREELERRIAARTVELTQTHLLLEQETLERARLERALDESEVRYRTLFENASEGTAALARTLKALTAERALDSFLSNILKKITQHLRARWAQLWLYRASQETMLLHMSLQDGTTLSPRERHALSQSPDVPESPLWREILQASCPIIIHDITQPTPLVNSASLLEQGVRTVILVPLLLEDEVSGYLSVQTSDQQEYQTEELLLAQALAQQMTLALQLSGFANERQQAAILEERNRLAREIHDTIAQGLTGILLQLEAAQEGLTSAPETVQTYLTRATTLAQTSLAEARRSVMALHPQALENDDLPTALNRTASEISTHTNTEITVHIHGTPYPLSSEIAANLLRIGQEAIINACKHAQPKVISLNLSFMTNELQLQIHDDGQGFDMTYPSRSSGFGLTSMRERAEQIGGQFTISSLPGQGTQITVSIPVSHFSSGELSL